METVRSVFIPVQQNAETMIAQTIEVRRIELSLKANSTTVSRADTGTAGSAVRFFSIDPFCGSPI